MIVYKFTVDYDEGIWFLHIETEAGDFRVQAHDEEMFDLDLQMQPVRDRKAEIAYFKREYDAGRLKGPDDTDGGGYEIDDPKHPDYYENFSVHADILRKREKGE